MCLESERIPYQPEWSMRAMMEMIDLLNGELTAVVTVRLIHSWGNVSAFTLGIICMFENLLIRLLVMSFKRLSRSDKIKVKIKI